LRRFLRLWPLYLFVIALAVLTLPYQLAALESVPWRTGGLNNDIDIHKEALAHFLPHLLAHLFMAQGLVSDHFLKFSNYTLVGQSWSISLEWQFYLIAPALFGLIKSRRWGPLSAIAVGTALLASSNYGGVGFIGNQYGYFLIGMVSYFAYKYSDFLASKLVGRVDFAVSIIAVTLYFVLKMPWPLILWGVILMTIIAEKLGNFGAVTRGTDRLLNLAPLRWLGRVSYSVYLVHILVLDAVMAIVLHFLPRVHRSVFLEIVLPSTIVATLLLSGFTFRLIEQPGMRLGKRLSSARAVEPIRVATY